MLKINVAKALDPRVANAMSPHEIMSVKCPNPVLATSSTANLETYDRIKSGIMGLYDKLSPVCDTNNCEQGDFAGCVLRMTGHDFMDFDDGVHGADGCVDFDDPDNTGLKACLAGEGEFQKGATLSDVYKDYCKEVSLADFFVIAAEAVMVRTRPDYNPTTKTSPTLNFRDSFKFGRETTTTCGDEAALPNPEDGCGAVDTVFVKRLGLSWRRAAALMGVHTLGRAKIENSGYDGFWVSPPFARIFGNHYYSVLQVGWVPDRAVGNNTNKNQWRRADFGPTTDMMLDTDFCLFWGTDDTAAGFDNGRGSCVWSNPNEFVPVQASPCETETGGRLPINTTKSGPQPSVKATCCNTTAVIKDPTVADRRRRFQKPNGTLLLGGFRADSFDGPAAVDVNEFAENEDVWLREFLEAWGHATNLSLKGVQPPPTDSEAGPARSLGLLVAGGALLAWR